MEICSLGMKCKAEGVWHFKNFVHLSPRAMKKLTAKEETV